MLARSSDAASAEAATRDLDGFGRAGTAPLVGTAARPVRARLAGQAGDLRRAGEDIDAAVARLPSDATPLMRLRFLTAQATIRNAASGSTTRSGWTTRR